MMRLLRQRGADTEKTAYSSAHPPHDELNATLPAPAGWLHRAIAYHPDRSNRPWRAPIPQGPWHHPTERM